MERIYRSTEPFLLPGNGPNASTAILMFHGFTGSPSELRRFGYYLNDEGYSVVGVRLPGHGTTPQDLIKTGWGDWWHHVLNTYDEIGQRAYERIIAVGFSMGGLLALKLSMERKIDGIVSVATPVFLTSKKSVFAVLLQYLTRYIEKERVYSREIIEEACAYSKIPIPCLVSMRKLMKLVKCSLSKVTAPIFIVQGECDVTVQPKSASYIYHQVSSVNKKISYYSRSSHAILLDQERDRVYKDIYAFIQSLDDKSQGFNE